MNLKNAILSKLNGIILPKGNRKSLKKFNHKFLKTASAESIRHTSFPVVDFRTAQLDGSMIVVPNVLRTDMRVLPMDMAVIPSTGYYYPKFHHRGCYHNPTNQKRRLRLDYSYHL